MKKTVMFIVAAVLATSSFAADLQTTVERAVFEAQQNNPVCTNPLDLAKTTFNGVPYVLTSSDYWYNSYESEKNQGNYLDNSSITIRNYETVGQVLKNNDYDLKDGRNPKDRMYAFSQINGEQMHYNVVRVVTNDKNEVMEYWFSVSGYSSPKEGEENLYDVIQAHRSEWIEALANWQAPAFDPRPFSCNWPVFRQQRAESVDIF